MAANAIHRPMERILLGARPNTCNEVWDELTTGAGSAGRGENGACANVNPGQLTLIPVKQFGPREWATIDAHGSPRQFTAQRWDVADLRYRD